MPVDKFVIHLCLCSTLLVSSIIFVFGIGATNNEVLCKAVAALLQYFLLAAQFSMMAEGILLIKVTSFPFRTNSIFKYLLPVIFGMPLLIVIISLAVDSDGFGTKQYCWIRNEKGLIFSFVGPVIGVVVFNLAVVLLILKTICGMDKVRRTNTIGKIKSALWAIAVLCPILGLFYGTGLFTFTAQSLTYEYLFVSLNSFQGVLIFVFQICIQSEIRNCIAESYSRYKSRQIVSP